MTYATVLSVLAQAAREDIEAIKSRLGNSDGNFGLKIQMVQLESFEGPGPYLESDKPTVGELMTFARRVGGSCRAASELRQAVERLEREMAAEGFEVAR